MLFRSLAQKSGAFTVDYVRTDEDMAQKMTAQELNNYDGVIFANTTGDLPLREIWTTPIGFPSRISGALMIFWIGCFSWALGSSVILRRPCPTLTRQELCV